MHNSQQNGASENRHPANIIGPRIRRIRYARGWSQAKLAVELQLRGLDVARDTIARIECQIHCVKDKDIPKFASTLGVGICDLFPASECNQPKRFS
jgi:transcriptional regulator with XRE-family HTH domain